MDCILCYGKKGSKIKKQKEYSVVEYGDLT